MRLMPRIAASSSYVIHRPPVPASSFIWCPASVPGHPATGPRRAEARGHRSHGKPPVVAGGNDGAAGGAAAEDLPRRHEGQAGPCSAGHRLRWSPAAQRAGGPCRWKTSPGWMTGSGCGSSGQRPIRKGRGRKLPSRMAEQDQAGEAAKGVAGSSRHRGGCCSGR
jgi:hypothetical protein